MKRMLSRHTLLLASIMVISCQSENVNAMTNDLKVENGELKTLIVYYSYTGTTEAVVSDLSKQIDADVLEIQPVDKSLDYAANNYRIGTEQLTRIQNNPNDESSYPAIEPVEVDLSKYDAIIIATPLWWSQMASNMQTFLFNYGEQMSDKHIGLIVCSHSSGIEGVENDAHRLVPNANFLSKSLWINNSNYSRRAALISEWLKDVGYESLTSSQQELVMTIAVGERRLTVDLVDNSSTQALVSILKEGDITYEAHDYGNFEKVGNIGYTLPTNDESITTSPGDIILYQGQNLCIYYDVNSWSFTRMGKIRGVTQRELKQILGTDNIIVTLSLGEASHVASPVASSSSSKNVFMLNGVKTELTPDSRGVYIIDGKKVML